MNLSLVENLITIIEHFTQLDVFLKKTQDIEREKRMRGISNVFSFT